ncbi:MAG: tRNA-(ms[2]io[6]A)-hydroxylase [Pseudomonadota bacterium]
MLATVNTPDLGALLANDADVTDLLACATPASWLEAAAGNLPVLLIDHANCEKKAASTAMALLFRYPEKSQLCYWMSRLAREELRHFEQVAKLIGARNIPWQQVPASRYAEGLRAHVRGQDPHRLVDILIVGALIEARSCERFQALAPHLDEELRAFYTGLCAAERRHFQRYLRLVREEADREARTIGEGVLCERIAVLVDAERALVLAPDAGFAFHSGVPSDAQTAEAI